MPRFRLSLNSLTVLMGAVFFLVSCGGGSSLTVPSSQNTTLSLGVNGQVVIQKGSIDGASSFSVGQVSAPVISDDIIPVGDAYKIVVQGDATLSYPAKIVLPIPEDEDVDELAIIRIESSGLISVLQTVQEGQNLIAWTPGFSTFVVGKLREVLLETDPAIEGPEIIPTGVFAQYRETAFQRYPGLNRQWQIFNADGSSVNNAELDWDSDNSLSNSIVRVGSDKVGSYMLMVTLSIPESGIKAVATEYISIQEETFADQDSFDLNISAPAFLEKGETLEFTAQALNTDISEITDWRWELRNASNRLVTSSQCQGAECDISLEGIPRFLDIGEIAIEGDSTDEESPYELTLIAESGLREGQASVNFDVLSNELQILDIYELSRSPDAWNVNLPFLPIAATFEAAIRGGSGVFTYEWSLSPTSQLLTNASVLETDSVTLNKFDQPGTYRVDLTVNDAVSSVSDSRLVVVGGQQDLEFELAEIVGPIVANQSMAFEFVVEGGVLIHNGYKFDYHLMVSWGDGEFETYEIEADHPYEGGRLTVSHTYSDVGDYQLTYAILPQQEYYPSVGSCDLSDQNGSSNATDIESVLIKCFDGMKQAVVVTDEAELEVTNSFDGTLVFYDDASRTPTANDYSASVQMGADSSILLVADGGCTNIANSENSYSTRCIIFRTSVPANEAGNEIDIEMRFSHLLEVGSSSFYTTEYSRDLVFLSMSTDDETNNYFSTGSTRRSSTNLDAEATIVLTEFGSTPGSTINGSIDADLFGGTSDFGFVFGHFQGDFELQIPQE